MRKIPVFTFINKLDRETKDPFDLIQELEDILGLPSSPVTWPIGCGMNFEGIYDLLKNEAILYKADKTMKLSAIKAYLVLNWKIRSPVSIFRHSGMRSN